MITKPANISQKTNKAGALKYQSLEELEDMGYLIYASYTKKLPKKKQENEVLKYLLLLIAKKYKQVWRKKKYVKLYSEETQEWSMRQTMRFVARESTAFIKDILPENYNGRIDKHASRRQIKRMMNDNCNYLSVHCITIIIVMLKLLLLDEESASFLMITGKNEDKMKIEADAIIDKSNNKDIPHFIMDAQISRLFSDSDLYDYAHGTKFLCDYIRDSYDRLNDLVGNDAYRAIHRQDIDIEGLIPILNIIPKMVVPFPE